MCIRGLGTSVGRMGFGGLGFKLVNARKTMNSERERETRERMNFGDRPNNLPLFLLVEFCFDWDNTSNTSIFQ